MTQVHLVLAQSSYRDDSTVLRVLDSRTSAERFISIHRADNPHNNDKLTILAMTVHEVTEAEFNDALAFETAVDQAGWEFKHVMEKDDAFFGDIKRRTTCHKCGRSVVQFDNNTIEQLGVQEACPKLV